MIKKFQLEGLFRFESIARGARPSSGLTPAALGGPGTRKRSVIVTQDMDQWQIHLFPKPNNYLDILIIFARAYSAV